MLERVNIRSEVPVYVQIENEIAFAISAGKVKPGDRLPAVREIADRIKINSNTVAKSIRDLELRGYILTQRGRGIFIEKGATEKCRKDVRREIAKSVFRVVAEAKEAGLTKQEIESITKTCLSVNGWPYDELPNEIRKLAD